MALLFFLTGFDLPGCPQRVFRVFWAPDLWQPLILLLGSGFCPSGSFSQVGSAHLGSLMCLLSTKAMASVPDTVTGKWVPRLVCLPLAGSTHQGSDDLSSRSQCHKSSSYMLSLGRGTCNLELPSGTFPQAGSAHGKRADMFSGCQTCSCCWSCFCWHVGSSPLVLSIRLGPHTYAALSCLPGTNAATADTTAAIEK